MFFTDDKRVYTELIVEWIKRFRETLKESPGKGNLVSGYCEEGFKPDGVKIVFDGYGENYFGELEISNESYIVFIHKDSLSGTFPEHKITPFGVIHRPEEEVSIYVWFDSNKNEFNVIPFEDNNSTEMNFKMIYSIIEKIHKKYYG